MKRVLIIIIGSLLIGGCLGFQNKYDPETGRYQVHSYDNSFLNTSSKLSQYYQCDKNKDTPENCKPTGTYHSDTTGVVPSVGGNALNGVAAGALIGDGLRDSNSNTNSSDIVIDNSCKGNCGGKS